MLASIIGFSRISIVGKYKFNEIYINTRMTILQIGFQIMIIMNVVFYDALDNWWHQNGNVIKHVNAFTNDIHEVMDNPFIYLFDNISNLIIIVGNLSTYLPLQMKFKKQSKRKRTMVENNTLMLQQFKINNLKIKTWIN